MQGYISQQLEDTHKSEMLDKPDLENQNVLEVFNSSPEMSVSIEKETQSIDVESIKAQDSESNNPLSEKDFNEEEEIKELAEEIKPIEFKPRRRKGSRKNIEINNVNKLPPRSPNPDKVKQDRSQSNKSKLTSNVKPSSIFSSMDKSKNLSSGGGGAKDIEIPPIENNDIEIDINVATKDYTKKQSAQQEFPKEQEVSKAFDFLDNKYIESESRETSKNQPSEDPHAANSEKEQKIDEQQPVDNILISKDKLTPQQWNKTRCFFLNKVYNQEIEFLTQLINKLSQDIKKSSLSDSEQSKLHKNIEEYKAIIQQIQEKNRNIDLFIEQKLFDSKDVNILSLLDKTLSTYILNQFKQPGIQNETMSATEQQNLNNFQRISPKIVADSCEVPQEESFHPFNHVGTNFVGESVFTSHHKFNTGNAEACDQPVHDVGMQELQVKVNSLSLEIGKVKSRNIELEKAVEENLRIMGELGISVIHGSQVVDYDSIDLNHLRIGQDEQPSDYKDKALNIDVDDSGKTELESQIESLKQEIEHYKQQLLDSKSMIHQLEQQNREIEEKMTEQELNFNNCRERDILNHRAQITELQTSYKQKIEEMALELKDLKNKPLNQPIHVQEQMFKKKKDPAKELSNRKDKELGLLRNQLEEASKQITIMKQKRTDMINVSIKKWNEMLLMTSSLASYILYIQDLSQDYLQAQNSSTTLQKLVKQMFNGTGLVKYASAVNKESYKHYTFLNKKYKAMSEILIDDKWVNVNSSNITSLFKIILNIKVAKNHSDHKKATDFSKELLIKFYNSHYSPILQKTNS